MSFWNTAARSVGEPFTQETFNKAANELYRQLDEYRSRPYQCPHTQAVVSPPLARALHDKPCPWGCGVTLVYGPLNNDNCQHPD